jgi:hypothetical protein
MMPKRGPDFAYDNASLDGFIGGRSEFQETYMMLKSGILKNSTIILPS